MKRQQYKFPKYIKNHNHHKEIKRAAFLYLLNQKFWINKSFFFTLRKRLKFTKHMSKLNVYCVMTGRVHYTIKLYNISRQIFFEYCRWGNIPGFFFSSQ